jgi:hypothetical protein
MGGFGAKLFWQSSASQAFRISSKIVRATQRYVIDQSGHPERRIDFQHSLRGFLGSLQLTGISGTGRDNSDSGQEVRIFPRSFLSP